MTLPLNVYLWNLRQDHARCHEIGERWIHGAVDGVPELNGHVAQFRIAAALAEKAHGEVPEGQLDVPIEHDADLLVGHVQPDLDLGGVDRFVVGVTSQISSGNKGVREVLADVDHPPSCALSHGLFGIVQVLIICFNYARIQMTQITTSQVLEVASILPIAVFLKIFLYYIIF